PYVGNNLISVEVLTFERAPVSTTTGRVPTDRCSLGSMSRGIHTRIIYDTVAYFAMPSCKRQSRFRFVGSREYGTTTAPLREKDWLLHNPKRRAIRTDVNVRKP